MSKNWNVCEHCGSQDLIEDEETGEIICAGCGLVVSEVNLIRRTFIDEQPHAASQRAVPLSVRSKMNRLMILDKRFRAEAGDPYVLRVAINEIKRLVQSMHLPDTVEKNADNIYRNAQKNGLVARGTITGFAAAAVYAACRTQGLPWTLRQVSDSSSENVKDISRMYRILLSELNISVELDNPLKHLSRIAGALDLSHRSERLAGAILEQIMRNNSHVGKNPKGLAASALYIACKANDEHCIQQSLSEAAGVSALTIRKRVKEIRENVNIETLIESLES
jgi:transcription initiation factor TFIIB